jgi:hypothetical protein
VPPQTQKTIGDTLREGHQLGVVRGRVNAALADGRQEPTANRAIIYNRNAGSLTSSPSPAVQLFRALCT